MRCERSYGSFARSFDISDVDADKITAVYENGVLRLTMPKKEKNVPAQRKLEIK
ncbi:MAG: Hsp20 family protein [Eubacteriales bacterium]